MFNKVIYKGTEILNISNDTVVAEALHAGYTAHDSNGVPINGTAKTYEEGYAAGQAAGGGGGASDLAAAAVMAMINKATSTCTGYNQTTQEVFMLHGVTNLAIIPPCITEIIGGDLDDIGMYGLDETFVLSLPAAPPVAGCFGYWSSSGANHPPTAIYVPDGSVAAYKTAENWSEFADIIKPMSDLISGSDDSGGETEETLITFTIEGTPYTALDGMTWAEWFQSSHNTCPDMSISDIGEICYIGNPLLDSNNNDNQIYEDTVIVAGHVYER